MISSGVYFIPRAEVHRAMQLNRPVKNTIWWIAGFTLNGEQIAELPNFTYTGRTITFSSALPAVYSGKDFEIKYIGT